MRTKRKKVASIAFTGAVAATAVAGAATPAHAAASHWTTTPGGPYTAHNETSALLNAGGIPVNCPVSSATATGSLATAADGIPVSLGAINTADFGLGGRCTTFGVPITAGLNHPAHLFGTGFTPGSNPSVTGVTAGELRSISATVNIAALACSFTVVGTLPGSYRNSNHTLVVNPSHSSGLHVTTTTCSDFPANTPAWFAANYQTNPAQTVIHSS